MQCQIEIETSKYEKLRKNPIFFVKYYSQAYYNNQGQEFENPEWRSVDKDLDIRFPVHDFGNPNLEYCLCIIDRAEFKIGNDGSPDQNRVIMFFHNASWDSIEDCYYLLINYINRYKDVEDKYAFMELLWFFDKYGIQSNILSSALKIFDKRFIPYVLKNLQKICRCLSLKNQKNIKICFQELGSDYSVYMPNEFIEAYTLIEQRKSYNDSNIYDIIDTVIGHNSFKQYEKLKSNGNILIDFVLWLNSETGLESYDSLKSIFSIVAEPIRLQMVRRYFHDIRLGYTLLDCSLLSQFKDNAYDEFIRYRYCIETPGEKVVLTVPLLCDNVLTLYTSKGSTFQTFDGVLDFAITHCDKMHPNVKFMLQRFIPTCENSVVYNRSFKGFVDYQLIRKMNIDLMTDDILFNTIRQILDSNGTRQKYPICMNDSGRVLTEDQYAKCSQLLCSSKEKEHKDPECIGYKLYDNRWFISKQYTQILNTFLKEEIQADINDEISVDLNMLSVSKFKRYILNLPTLFTRVTNEEFLVSSDNESSKNDYNYFLIKKFSDILRMRIVPQKGAKVGKRFDIFGYWEQESRKLSPEDLCDSHSPNYLTALDTYYNRESEEVTRRTVRSLKQELNISEYNGEFFELQYNHQTLFNILHKYYFKGSFSTKDSESHHDFLSDSIINSNFKPYCAPQLSDTNNPAIDLPYFWCRGKECFRNNLNDQTLDKMSDWRNYSLYHMVEIIGYPKLHKTRGGNEPDSAIMNFIAITNKALQKFRRLKCRECGHLMYTDKSSGFNRYNYYSCINPSCPEYQKPVYLNFCYNCKKGLIDSRDSVQCPNGWYICPTCLSCCNDAQYERLAQRYILSQRPIPNWIKTKLGCGHNDKGEYYCPNCGSLIEIIQDEHGGEHRFCSNCKKYFKNDDEMF